MDFDGIQGFNGDISWDVETILGPEVEDSDMAQSSRNGMLQVAWECPDLKSCVDPIGF